MTELVHRLPPQLEAKLKQNSDSWDGFAKQFFSDNVRAASALADLLLELVFDGEQWTGNSGVEGLYNGQNIALYLSGKTLDETDYLALLGCAGAAFGVGAEAVRAIHNEEAKWFMDGLADLEQ